MLKPFEHVFPLVAGDKQGEVTVVAGTVFSIGGDRFMTAGHCVVTAFEREWQAIGIARDREWNFFDVTSAEYDDDYDVAFFQADLPAYGTLKWATEDVHMGESLCSVGYAHAFDPDRKALGIRTFMSYVVGSKEIHRPRSTPGIYELSFQCPRGLSGAPVFTPTADPRITGVVIGNASMEMEVYSSREVSEKDDKVETYTRFEALQLGVALRKTSVLDVKSPKILGGTLGEHLAKHGL